MHHPVPHASIPSIEHEGLGFLWAELSSANADGTKAPSRLARWLTAMAPPIY
jgi:hypothetical protein